MQSFSILSKQSLSIPSKNISSLSLIPLLHIVDWILLISAGVPLFPFNHYMLVGRQGVSLPCAVCAAVKDSGLLCAAHRPGEDIAHPMDTGSFTRNIKEWDWNAWFGVNAAVRRFIFPPDSSVRSLSFQPTRVLLQADVLLLKLPMPVPPLSASRGKAREPPPLQNTHTLVGLSPAGTRSRWRRYRRGSSGCRGGDARRAEQAGVWQLAPGPRSSPRADASLGMPLPSREATASLPSRCLLGFEPPRPLSCPSSVDLGVPERWLRFHPQLISTSCFRATSILLAHNYSLNYSISMLRL